jgi:hypothetical protein
MVEPSAGLKLADGSVVRPDGTVVKPKKQELVEVPSNTRAQKLVADTRKRIADLPAPPQSMNAVGVVLMYALFGLEDIEIALATNLSVDQIGRIKMLEAYAKMQDVVVDNLMTADTENVRSLIAQHQKKAVNKVVDLIENGDDSLALSAAKDLLDRGRNRPVDIVEHQHKLEGGLVIEVRKKSDAVVAPAIDVQFEETP